MAMEKPTILDQGNLPSYPSSPNVMKNAILAGLLGGMLAGGIILALHMMDDTIKGSDDVERYLELSTLGLIPLENSKEIKKNRRRRTLETIDKKDKKGKS
jgi:capsular polysaccharide biosynthesis protein